MLIPIGSDHAGYTMKETLMVYLRSLGHEVKDYGCFSQDSIDYPDFAHPVAKHISAHPQSLGILLCGSGNGISMTANKHAAIRCALCWDEEIAQLARQHNDANIVALPARFISDEKAKVIVKIFLETNFEGGRHANRVAKISCQ